MSSSEQQEAPVRAADTAVSPARSDKSSESEGRPVREKFQKTSIDATATPISGLGHVTADNVNGSLQSGSGSASGSDSDRGHLRRKRSREDLDEDHEGDKQPDKKHERLEQGSEKPARHARKRSKDITKDLEDGALAKSSTTPVSRIDEVDAEMASPSKSEVQHTGSETRPGASPKNKRPRAETEGTEPAHDSTTNTPANGQTTKSGDERESKRVRDSEGIKSPTPIPAGSGFANTSAASPFAAVAAKSAPPKVSEEAEALPQTSEDKFKASGFGSLASSTTSPFGNFGAAAKAASPFGGAPKLSSFASPTTTSLSTAPSSGSGFGALGGAKSSFGGGSAFGGASSSPFGGSFASKPLGGSSFATPGAPGITGLSSKPERAFGAPGDKGVNDASDDEEDDNGDEDPEKDAEEGKRPGQPLSSTIPTETGEEHEVTAWVGRAKLYTMDGEGKERGWKERGVGNIKLNVTKEEPKKARFVLRADGTHRLILNAAVTKTLVFGADSEGAKPKDGRLLFNSPDADGNLDMHLLKLKSERAVELWEQVAQVQNDEL
ncbi:hypothetical protein B5807_07315 [Epicoccum nigrum]|uniref:RanBD1 domain-containing protein n=1 Tax=Epicoccum nigrum TaxID=105696 RepID=A0A1Y2LUV0_EPING|nr:hypothetical protein B5807_07315 [Epicoccum nigrum]